MYTRVYRWCVGIVGPLASLAGCHRSWRHHTLSYGWSVGIVGRLPEVMTSSHTLAWLVRWHRWQAARGHDVTTLAWLVRWHRWQLGIVGSLAARGHDVTCSQLSHGWCVGIVGPLAGCQRSWRHNSRMVGPLASLATWHRWQLGRQRSWRHMLSALAWLQVRWSVGRLPEVMTHVQLSHGWSVGRLPEVMTSQLSHGTWSVGIVGRLPEVMTSHVHSPWLVRWHRWSVGRLPEVMTSHTLASRVLGPLASLFRWHRWQAAR